MGAARSSLLARSLSRTLSRTVSRSRSKAAATTPLGHLGSTPDVIEAHERYARNGTDTAGYSYYRPGPAPARPHHPTAQQQTTHQQTTQEQTTQLQQPQKPARTPRRSRRHRRSRTPRTSASCPRSSRSRDCREASSKKTDKGCFGYDIQDVDGFLAKASLERPANIPMVLGCASVLYRTREGGWQDEVSLPLGMVVNGVFRASCWLYAQTPHGHEGYVRYSACLPLGILPPPATPGRRPSKGPPPCWDTASDVFPAPSGNRTDTDKLKDTRSERSYGGRRAPRFGALEAMLDAERRVDALYLRAARSETGSTAGGEARTPRGPSRGRGAASVCVTSERRPLVIAQRDFQGGHGDQGAGGTGQQRRLSVARGDVMAVLGSPARGWLRVRIGSGQEGLVPAGVAGSGYL